MVLAQAHEGAVLQGAGGREGEDTLGPIRPEELVLDVLGLGRIVKCPPEINLILRFSSN